MIDKRLLDFKYPLVCHAFVHNGQYHSPPFVLDGKRRTGHWVLGVARMIYAGAVPIGVEFFNQTGAKYIIEHSAQLIPREILI